MSFLNNIFLLGVEIIFVIDSPYLWTIDWGEWVQKSALKGLFLVSSYDFLKV